MSSTYPQILGFENLVYSNYNSDQTQGLELGINYRFDVAKDFSITAGSNFIYISPKITKREEPVYEGADMQLLRKGTATDALWALNPTDCTARQILIPMARLFPDYRYQPLELFKPGDIKYLDQNGDNIIDQNDQRIIGHGVRTQYSFYLDINYKNFEFYILGIGQTGD